MTDRTDVPPPPPALLARPIAHRGLWRPEGPPENSLAAVLAGAEAGYGVEIDVRLSSDGHPVVFHDAVLGRMTPEAGPVAERTLADLTAIPLRTGGTIPSLASVLGAVEGRAPLLVEIKDGDGALGPDVGALEDAVARALGRHEGPAAVMSFNSHSVAALRAAAPALPRGLVTCAFAAPEWPQVPSERLDRLRALDPDAVGAGFVSHDVRDLASPHLDRVRGRLPILCWTVRSEAQGVEARRHAAQITFEGHAPAA